jgi:hypothetical protein
MIWSRIDDRFSCPVRDAMRSSDSSHVRTILHYIRVLYGTAQFNEAVAVWQSQFTSRVTGKRSRPRGRRSDEDVVHTGMRCILV